MAATRIIEEFDLYEYDELIVKYNGRITVSPHAHFRLSEAQRKVYKDIDIINTLVKEKPSLFGLQQNGKYTALFNRKDGYLRIAFNITETNIEVVTFYNVDNIPKL